MKYPVIVPRTSDGALKLTILRWIKNVGDDVRKGDDLVEARTEKITLYISVPEAGKLAEISAPVGQLVDVGEVIGYVEG
jgi:pyruvate/2-oxoglutarate dehydrogenase complex dihydrolipoamide acyltransferase (E2) component